MTDTLSKVDLDSLLARANPLDAGRARALAVTSAERALLTGMLADPPEPLESQPRAVHPRRAHPRRAHPRRADSRRAHPHRRSTIALGVAAALGGLVIVSSLGGGGSGDRSGTVWAAELVRFADTSPLVLLQAGGWRVEYADEQSPVEGELHFRRGPAPPPVSTVPTSATATDYAVPTTIAALNWRAGALSAWTRDRAASADVQTHAPVLGTSAAVYQYAGGHPGHRDITALWRYKGRVLEFRAGAADIAGFESLLAALHPVDADAWLSALPDSVVKSTGRPAAIAGMLEGVTLPPGFDPSTIKGPELTKDRYQLGAAVTGTVACAWFKRWSEARTAGDAAGVRAAIAAMATAKNWPILHEMAKSGAYPQVLEDFAAAMASGRWAGRPLEGDVDSGLGCRQLGIPLADPGRRP